MFSATRSVNGSGRNCQTAPGMATTIDARAFCDVPHAYPAIVVIEVASSSGVQHCGSFVVPRGSGIQMQRTPLQPDLLGRLHARRFSIPKLRRERAGASAARASAAAALVKALVRPAAEPWLAVVVPVAAARNKGRGLVATRELRRLAAADMTASACAPARRPTAAEALISSAAGAARTAWPGKPWPRKPWSGKTWPEKIWPRKTWQARGTFVPGWP